ncbi:hypothetical protein [Natronospira sp.]|uniref:hypothetical protein n=1 Tax=Natronospira sp. TaxID=2024970 RepID=UPI0038731500
MGRNLQNRSLRLIIGKDHITKIEKFVELICDDYHIYDEYYANIIASNTLLAEYIYDLSNDRDHRLDIRFVSDKNGVRFIFSLGDIFLDFARYHERASNFNIIDSEETEESLRKFLIIKLLCDDIFINPENETVELFFRISGVNEMLTNQRIELLNKYFSMIQYKIKQ